MAEENNQVSNENAENIVPEVSVESVANNEETPQSSVVETAAETATPAVESVAENITSALADATGTVDGNRNQVKAVKQQGRRAQKIGTVSSDKMTKTVVVNVDRQILHPKYRRYIRRTSKFMAHDETGATIGDKVRIEETRPLSARKRWRVIEVLQKAAK